MANEPREIFDTLHDTMFPATDGMVKDDKYFAMRFALHIIGGVYAICFNGVKPNETLATFRNDMATLETYIDKITGEKE